MKCEDLQAIIEKLIPLFKEKRVLKAILFGSAARKTCTRRSDLDLIIVTETDKRFFDRYDDFREVYDLAGKQSVDLLIYTPRELERIAQRPFIRQIMAEGKTIYEQTK